MNEVEIERRITQVEERAKSNTHRIDKAEEVVDEIHTMSKTMVELVQEIKHINKTVVSLDHKLGNLDGRVRDIERAPGEDYKKYRSTVVTAVISTIAGALASGMIMLIAQNI